MGKRVEDGVVRQHNIGQADSAKPFIAICAVRHDEKEVVRKNETFHYYLSS